MNQPSPERRRAARPLQARLGLEVHIDDDLLEPLDRWIAANPKVCPSRPAAVRYALRQWLSQAGLVTRNE